MVQFQATLIVPGSDHVSIAAVQTWVEVARMPVTYTVGPVQRTIDTTSDLTVNAALSFDPDGILNSRGFFYDWKCTYEVTLPLDVSKVNIAVCKKATSSGVGFGGYPEKANDGNNGGGMYASGSCAHSAGEANPWWMVDLGTQYPIERIVVYNRLDCCSDRISPSNIHVGNSPVLLDNPIVGNINYVAGTLAYEFIYDGIMARYAGIALARAELLNFCEFEVYTNEAALLPDDCEVVLGCLVHSAPNGERMFTRSLITHDRPPGLIANVTVNITAGLFPTVSLYQTIHVVPDESLSGLYLECTENCNQYSTIAAWPLVLDTPSEIQGTIEYSLVEYPAGHAAENWTSVIEVVNSTLMVPAGIFVDVGFYTIRLTDTVGSWEKFSDWRFEVLPNPSPGSADNSTAEGDLQDLSGLCTLIPATGTALIDKFCVTCQEFVDLLGPLETQVTFELEPLAEIATVTFPGDGPPTVNEIILNSFTGWVRYTNLFDLSSGIVILHVRIGSPDGRFIEFDLEPAQIKAPTMEQLQGYLDGFITYPTGTFFSLIRRGEAGTAFLGSVIASYTASHIAADGGDITEGVDTMAAGFSELNVQDMETVNGASLSLVMLTAIPEMVSGNTQVLSANVLSECLKSTREQSTNVTEMPTEEVNKAAALMFTGVVNILKASETMSVSEHLEDDSLTDNLQNNQEATEIGFNALDVLDEIYLINRMPEYPNREMFADVAMSTVQVRIQRELQDDPSERVYTVGGTGGRSNSLVRVPSFSSLVNGACPGDTVGVQFLESNFNPFEYSNNSRIIRADVTGLHVKCGNVTILVSGLSQPNDILTSRKNGSLEDSMYVFKTSEPLGSVTLFQFLVKKNQSALSFSFDFNSTLFPHGITLFLRKEAPPTPEDYNWTTTLPVPDEQIVSIPWINGTVLTSNPYHWLLSPEEIDITNVDVENMTNYFLGVRFGSEQNLSSGHIVDFTLHIFETSCVYFDENVDLWHSDGCNVGMMSNASHIHCRCDHLTKFSGFVAPNPLNIAAALSANVLENPAGLILVLTVLGMYFMGVLWARKQDRRDLAKVGVGILPGHRLNPRKDCQYVITVYTGFKGNAGTTAEVTIVLYSQDRESPPFILSDSSRITFEKGSVDSFLVSTSEPLGDLTYLRVWHNNAGYSPAWFLSQIVVTNRENNKSQFFLCNRWFATDKDDGKVYRLLPESGPDEMKEFRNVFLAKSSRDMNDGHLWFSVAGRPARSPFTRVQRLSCCLTLLYSTMVTNIMFFGRGDDFDPPEPLRFAGMEINPPMSLPQIMIGLQSAAIILPVNLLIVFLFRNSDSKPTKRRKKKSENNAPFHNLAKYLPDKKECNKPRTIVLYHSGVDTPSFWHREETDSKLKRHFDSGSPSYVEPTGLSIDNTTTESNTDEDAGDFEEKGKSSIPWWAVYFGWLLVWSASFVAAFFTVLYSLSFGRAKAEAWLFTFLTSFLTDLFLVQPFKLLLVAMLFALLVKKPVEDDAPEPAPLQHDEEYFQDNRRMVENRQWSTATGWMRYLWTEKTETRHYKGGKASGRVHSNSPPEESALAEQRAESTQKRRRRKQIVEVLMFGLFVTVIMLTSYGERSPLAFYVTKDVQGLILDRGDISFSEIQDIPTFWTWVQTGLIPATHVSRWYNGWSVTETMVLDDMLTHPLGPVQLRQVRLKPGESYISII
ncbi:polycystin-1-like protein 2 [Branchiostoma floridae x Branchiostoma belcheri]